MAWVALTTAIFCGIVAALFLQPAVTGRPIFLLPVLVGYTAAFGALTVVLREGMSVGVAYGIWAATDIAAVAVLARLLFNEPLTRMMTIGIGLIAGGVLLVEVGAH